MKKLILSSILILFLLLLNNIFMKEFYVLMRALKAIVMLGIPMFLIKEYKLKSLKMNSKDLKYSFMIGFAIIIILQVTYMVLVNIVDLTSLIDTFSNTYKLDIYGFALAALYTIFINCFIEEYLFRGHIFLGLLKYTNRKKAYIISGLFFSLYHLTIFDGWFSLWVTGLMLFGLFIGGLIFNYFADKNKNILIPYIIHMMADIGVVIVGIQMLY